jgi:hypothetical protein
MNFEDAIDTAMWRGGPIMRTRKLEKWRLASRRSDHVKVTTLWLYPELDCSSCIDDVFLSSGAEQLDYYVDYIKTAYEGRYRHWWDNDAVPVYWSVRGEDDGFGCEQAPFHAGTVYHDEDILTHYHTPISLKTGRPINWYTSLLVINDRFPKFARALAWLPSPGQMYAPLRSIIQGPPSRSMRKAEQPAEEHGCG